MTQLFVSIGALSIGSLGFIAGMLWEKAKRPLLGSGECAGRGCPRNPYGSGR